MWCNVSHCRLGKLTVILLGLLAGLESCNGHVQDISGLSMRFTENTANLDVVGGSGRFLLSLPWCWQVCRNTNKRVRCKGRSCRNGRCVIRVYECGPGGSKNAQVQFLEDEAVEEPAVTKPIEMQEDVCPSVEAEVEKLSSSPRKKLARGPRKSPPSCKRLSKENRKRSRLCPEEEDEDDDIDCGIDFYYNNPNLDDLGEEYDEKKYSEPIDSLAAER